MAQPEQSLTGLTQEVDASRRTQSVDSVPEVHAAFLGASSRKRKAECEPSEPEGSHAKKGRRTKSLPDVSFETKDPIKDLSSSAPKTSASEEVDPAVESVPQTCETDKASLRVNLWMEELETIRRPEPLWNESVELVTIMGPRNVPASTPDQEPHERASEGSSRESAIAIADDDEDTSGTSSANPIVLGVDDEQAIATSASPIQSSTASSVQGSGSGRPKRVLEEPLEFYGGDGVTDSMVRFQDRRSGRGKIPGPMTSDRLLRPRLRNELNLKTEARPFASHPACRDLYWEYPLNCEESIASGDWCPSSKAPLLKGFPLVEDVVFLRDGNTHGISNCYWNAISLHMYGTHEFAARVKGEHLDHVRAVLSNEHHPMYDKYTAMNSKFYKTEALPFLPVQANVTPVLLNLWQILNIPGAWTPAAMMEITADVYGVFIVMYSMQGDRVQDGKVITEVKTAGPYNARHLFLLYVGNCHFQPMTPNEYYGWEFQCPRITRASTMRYLQGPQTGQGKDGIAHPWRREFSKSVLPPVPVDHTFDVRTLQKTVAEKHRATQR
ncbi:uncharacterized protein E0L32_004842 [Thyridium curvatum]|uniref:Uncharacterized protein n=1 Tax=Thyridium curvatum TaxID=1093900 RepID=A0A507AYF2_9PEZI|nr:uncharacterized protein E0L32_004842 [Thyridium curvatum]TPX15012.1 hypothetical protein E0L32_004842 [Thyridium curvatum]